MIEIEIIAPEFMGERHDSEEAAKGILKSSLEELTKVTGDFRALLK